MKTVTAINKENGGTNFEPVFVALYIRKPKGQGMYLNILEPQGVWE